MPAWSDRSERTRILLLLCCGGVLTLLGGRSSCLGQVDRGGLIVNEVFFRAIDSDLEYIEIFNTSANRIDLSQIQMSDSRRRLSALTEAHIWISGGEYAVVTNSAEAFDARFGYPARLPVEGWPVLNNGGDEVLLWNGGSVIDSMSYRSSWGDEDASLERIDPRSSAARYNWAPSVDRRGGTPGEINSVFAADVTAPRVVFCEEDSEGRLAVHFSEPLMPASVRPSSFEFEGGEFPGRATLEASHQVVLLDDLPPGDLTTLSVSGVADESGNVLERTDVPVAWLARSGEIVVNEIMYEPLADAFDGLPDQTEYVELASVSERTLSAGSLIFTDRLREDGTRDTLRLTDRRQAIEQGMLVLAYANPDPSNDPLAAFPAFDRSDPHVLLLPVPSSSLSLSNNGDKIRLERLGGVLIDEVEFDPSWHLPERIETRGVSLERISVRGATGDPANWTSSVDPSGGTPGARNSVLVEREEGSTTDPGILTVEPSPFSPDGDGYQDVTFIQFESPYPSSVARIWIFDLNGIEVRELEQALPIGRSSAIAWDGYDQSGKPVRTGVYIILLEAVDAADGRIDRQKRAVAVVRP